MLMSDKAAGQNVMEGIHRKRLFRGRDRVGEKESKVVCWELNS